MKNSIIGAGVILAIALVLFQRNEIADLKQKLAAFEAASLVNETAIPDETSTDAVAETEFAEDASEPLVISESYSSIDDEKPRDRIMRNFSKMMENPAYNKMMAASQKAALEVMYEDLIDYLVLDEREEEYFMDLLLSRQMKQVEHAMNIMGGQVSDEERKAARDDIKSFQKEIREEMEYFLNDSEDLAEWEFYEKTTEQRMALSGVEQELEKTGIPLEDGVSRQLVELMHEETKAYNFSSNLNDQENLDMSAERFSKENIDALEYDLENLDTSIAQRAENVLSAEQFDVFKKNQSQMRELKLSQLKMASQMFSNRQQITE